MDIAALASGGAGAAFIGLALYLVKVVVNDINHDIRAVRTNSERQVDLLERILERLEKLTG